MLLFRSEEGARAWSVANDMPVGAMLSVEQIWALSMRWYATRMNPDYAGRGTDVVAGILREAGLTGDFWEV